MRRDTIQKLAGRRSTILNEVRRRSSIGIQVHEANRARRRSTLNANQESDSNSD